MQRKAIVETLCSIKQNKNHVKICGLRPTYSVLTYHLPLCWHCSKPLAHILEQKQQISLAYGW